MIPDYDYRKEYSHTYYENNKERIKELNRIYYENNKERLKKSRRAVKTFRVVPCKCGLPINRYYYHTYGICKICKTNNTNKKIVTPKREKAVVKYMTGIRECECGSKVSNYVYEKYGKCLNHFHNSMLKDRETIREYNKQFGI